MNAPVEVQPLSDQKGYKGDSNMIGRDAMGRSLILAVLLGLSTLGIQPTAQAIDVQTPAEAAPQGENGLGVGAILNLINVLRSTSASPQVDLSPEVAQTRERLSGLYFRLANLYLIDNQVSAACEALTASHINELEAYLRRRLDPNTVGQNDCFASALGEVSALTGSRTAPRDPDSRTTRSRGLSRSTCNGGSDGPIHTFGPGPITIMVGSATGGDCH